MSSQQRNPNASPYLGSLISLISMAEIRYEGLLYEVDTNESTIALTKVKSFGTENRPVKIYVAPVSETFEFIIFKAHDIKDLTVVAPPAQTQLHDPAILSVGAQTPAPPQRPHLSPVDSARAHWPPLSQTAGYDFAAVGQGRGPPLSVPYQQPPLRFQATGHPSADFPMSGTQPQPHPMRMNVSAPARPRFDQLANNGYKYKEDYDFEKANREFEKFESQLKSMVDEKKKDGAAVVPDEVCEDKKDRDQKTASNVYYNKKKSFFDNLSTDADERAAHLQRVDGGGDHEGGEGDTQTYDIPYRNQRTLNSQTFGLNALREQMWMRMQPTGGGAQQNGGSYARFNRPSAPWVDPRAAHAGTGGLFVPNTSYFYTSRNYAMSTAASRFPMYPQDVRARFEPTGERRRGGGGSYNQGHNGGGGVFNGMGDYDTRRREMAY